MGDLKIKFDLHPRKWKGEIKEILVEANHEFVPPIETPPEEMKSEDVRKDGRYTIDGYVEEALKNKLILALKGEELVGFLEFIHGYESPNLRGYCPCNYEFTVVVRRNHRREGIGTDMYKKVLYGLPESLRLPYVVTRTWSTNLAHINLLEKLGFRKVKQIDKDRVGGVHTVYFAKEIRSVSFYSMR